MGAVTGATTTTIATTITTATIPLEDGANDHVLDLLLLPPHHQETNDITTEIEIEITDGTTIETAAIDEIEMVVVAVMVVVATIDHRRRIAVVLDRRHRRHLSLVPTVHLHPRADAFTLPIVIILIVLLLLLHLHHLHHLVMWMDWEI